MVIIYFQTSNGTIHADSLSENNSHLLQNALWVDLLSPTKREEKIIKTQLKLTIPTKKEMEEIEPSSRLYVKNNNLFMTATMVTMSELPEVKNDVVTFILTPQKLITLRHVKLYAFKLFIEKLLQSKNNKNNAASILITLLDAVTDRLADILEKVSHKFDEISQLIFYPSENESDQQERNYKHILQSIGASGDLGTKVSESLVSFIRLLSFLETYGSELYSNLGALLPVVNKDVYALRDHASFLSAKFNFLLDATLGMINIEQNNIIKIFSVAAVIFLPPTLVASIYGMNFIHIPELKWYLGYPFAIFLMLMSAWLPFKYFKKKKWL